MFLFLAFKLSERSYITSQQSFKGRNLDILKKFLVIIISLGILAALFFLGMAFFAIVLIALPIIYVYQKYKLNTKSPKPAPAQAEINIKTIEAEFEVIEEIKK